jgi:hypothetical protein
MIRVVITDPSRKYGRDISVLRWHGKDFLACPLHRVFVQQHTNSISPRAGGTPALTAGKMPALHTSKHAVKETQAGRRPNVSVRPLPFTAGLSVAMPGREVR